MTTPSASIPSATTPAAADHIITVALIGEGISASFTPPMHEREAEHLGLHYRYETWDLLTMQESADDIGLLLDRARDRGLAALNITHPCKQRVLAHLDELSPEAAHLGAVNLVLIRDGRFIGHNTDWTGFRAAVLDGLPSIAGSSVAQFGTGGAGAATAYALLDLGVSTLTLVDVDSARALAAADSLQANFPSARVTAASAVDAPLFLGQQQGVVHATPTGMAEHPGVAFDVSLLNPDAWVADVVYRPLRTQLIEQASAAGHAVLDGGRMAVGQAADSIRLITGIEPKPERMRKHFLELLANEQAAQPASAMNEGA
ncbi:shikimate dehydrogenase [Lysinibacter cavernae]|uniref:Shikimate dehydrogenase n=1 Tax=Lysinibacter cavernae TaxID=1640652 RepID=A0A7X5TSQ1_9MICO|nr:shikimate dehydrogenase [Lysinibacter cavernae]NIH53290.1 shikimate dehydrogenase [Lysinibacter cavernae]